MVRNIESIHLIVGNKEYGCVSLDSVTWDVISNLLADLKTMGYSVPDVTVFKQTVTQNKTISVQR